MSVLDLSFDFNSLNLSSENNGWDDGLLRVKEFILLEVLVAFFAAFGNFLVIIIFYKDKHLRKKSNYYIISLACADFCVAICGIPLAISLVRFHFIFSEIKN